MMPESYKEREKHRREEEIIAASGRLIREYGYHELTMDTLAEAIGISKPTLYQHFKSKDELIGCVILRSYRALDDHLQTNIHLRPLERLQHALRWMLVRCYTSEDTLAGIQPEANPILIESNRDLMRQRARLKELICAIIDEGKARGEIQTQTPTLALAALLISLIHLPKLMGAPHGESSAALDEMIEHTVTLFTRAAQAHE